MNARIQDFAEYCDDFHGHGELPSSQSDSDWLVDDTSSAGTPTYTKGGVNGEATLAFDSQAEIQNVCLHHGDDLNFDIDLIDHIEIAIKGGQAALDATTMLAVGLASARNDAIDSIGEAALFRVIGADSTTAIVVETDDGTNNNDDVATGKSLADSYVHLLISFASGKSDVRFHINGSRVAKSTTFDMSNYSGALQPIIQLQKTADANTDSVVVDYVKIVSRRS